MCAADAFTSDAQNQCQYTTNTTKNETQAYF